MLQIATLDAFTLAYVDCALWSSTGDDEQPLDETYGVEDIAPVTLASMVADCKAFQEAHGALIGDDEERAGHDFWLTRNGHGAGFWDGDWDEVDPTGILDKACKAFPGRDLYVGDDGLIYMS